MYAKSSLLLYQLWCLTLYPYCRNINNKQNELPLTHLESLVHFWVKCQHCPLFIPVRRFEELSGRGGYPHILSMVGEVYFVLSHMEYQLSNVFIGRLIPISIELLNHFLEEQESTQQII